MSSLELRSKAVPEGSFYAHDLGPADPALAEEQGEGEDRRLIIPFSAAQKGAFEHRMNLSLCPGLEGAGTVVAAGAGGEYLMGRTIAMFGGGIFAQYRISIGDCLVPPEGTPPIKAAASFVNPLAVLGMLETLRREGHKALVHTVGASGPAPGSGLQGHRQTRARCTDHPGEFRGARRVPPRTSRSARCPELERRR